MKKYLPVLSILTILLCFSCDQKAIQNHILQISSIDNAPWQIDTLRYTEGIKESTQRIEIYPDSTLQIINGFGACFNELGWEALQTLLEEQQETILKALFDDVDGCNFNLCRMPMGANDYAVDWYSHNEQDQDFNMDQFSIARDLQRLVPYIKKAKEIKPEISIWASPWCPPAWMKTNKHYACRPDKVNDLPDSGAGQEMKTQFVMEKNYLDAYALYFSKFIQSYQEQDIKIEAIHVQNEPNSCQSFPSCVWRPEDLATFIGKHLGPKLKGDHPDTEIWLGTIERPQEERVKAILDHTEAKEYITGVGFQWGGKGAIPYVNKNYPDLRLMQTETECGNGSNDWQAAEHTFGLMKHYFANGANAYLYWNMILDETGKSQWGWKQNSMISIHTETGEVTYNPEYYLMKHFSAFIQPGAKHLKTNRDDCLAFSNDTEIIVIYYNNNEIKEQKTFQVGNSSYEAWLAPKSFNTFVIKI